MHYSHLVNFHGASHAGGPLPEANFRASSEYRKTGNLFLWGTVTNSPPYKLTVAIGEQSEKWESMTITQMDIVYDGEEAFTPRDAFPLTIRFARPADSLRRGSHTFDVELTRHESFTIVMRGYFDAGKGSRTSFEFQTRLDRDEERRLVPMWEIWAGV